MPRVSASALVVEHETTDLSPTTPHTSGASAKATATPKRTLGVSCGDGPIRSAGPTQPLARRLAEDPNASSFLLFLMLHSHVHPGYDYLVARKLVGFWSHVEGSTLEDDLITFRQGAEAIGFSPPNTLRVASQSVGRLLIQTGRSLDELTLADLEDMARACQRRERATGEGWGHYRVALHAAQRVLFHLGIVDELPPSWQGPRSFVERMADVVPALRPAFVTYLERKAGTCRAKTVTVIATRLAHFGRFLAEIDPDMSSLAELERCRHIEPYLNSLTSTINSKTGGLDHGRRPGSAHPGRLGLPHRHRRVGLGAGAGPQAGLSLRHAASAQVLPRYLPVDADRRLSGALERSEYRLAADALLLQRACGLRIGELLDLELDCVHEIPGNGAWLKVPLGKLDTERMVPLDDETVALLDRIVATRSDGRPIPHPRTGHRVQFLFTHHGRRLGQQAVRLELDRAAAGGRARACDQPPAPPHVRHGHGERGSVAAEPHGTPRTCLGRDEPALRTPLRHHRARRVRAGPRARQRSHRLVARRPQTHSTYRRRRLARGAGYQGPPGRGLLPAGTGPGGLSLRQHLRALSELPHRCRERLGALGPAGRRRSPARRRRSQGMGRGSRPSPPACRSPRRPARRGHGRMTSPETLARVERACAELVHDAEPVTFAAVAERAEVSRTSLYRDDNLRAVVDEHRQRGREPRSLSGIVAEVGHLRTAVEALAERVRRHEEQLRRLDRTPKAN